MSNGEVVIDRLDSVRRSLTRALTGVEREMANRKADETYTQTYLNQLTNLGMQAQRLEDLVVEKLNYA